MIRVLATSENQPHTGYTHIKPVTQLSTSDFELRPNEEKALSKLKAIASNYNLLKVACTTHATTLIDFQTYLNLSSKLAKVERSNIIYYKVLDQKNTLLSIINDQFIATQK